MKQPTLNLARARRAGLAACAALVLGACNAGDFDGYLRSGSDYLAKQDYRAAAIQFKNAVQARPADGQARFLLGETLRQGGDLDAAEIELRKALDAGFDANRVVPALMRSLVASARYDKVLSEPHGALTSTAALAEAEALRGQAHLGLGHRDDARKSFETARATDPANPEAALGLARLSAADGQAEAADRLVQEVLERTPEQSEALLLKGDMLAARGRTQEAVTSYEAVIQKHPRHPGAHMRLVPLLLRNGQVDVARIRVDALGKAAPNSPGARYLDALVSYAQGKPDDARAAVLEVLKAAPDHIPSLLLAGSVEHDSGHYAQAEEHLRKALQEAPRLGYARRLLVSTLLRMGETERARTELEPLLEQSGDQTQVLLLAGEVALANRDVRQAAEHFAKVAEREPGNIASRVRLGQARLAAGETQRAIEDLEAAAQADTRGFQADVALLTLHLNRNELDKAVQRAEQLLRKQPANPMAYNLRGLTLLARSDRTGARKDFQRALELQPTYFPAVHNLALLDRRDGQPAQARQRYEKVLQREPRHEQALVALVELARETGAPRQEVEAALRRALQGSPQSVRAHLHNVSHWLAMGDAKQALSAAQAAQATLPDNLQVLTAAGRAQLTAGDTNQAITTFGRIAAAMPRSPQPLLAQAQALSAAKSWDSARQTLQKALDLQPNLAEAWRGLVAVGIASGRFDLAQADAREIQKRWPGQPLGYVAESEVLQAQKKWTEADRVLQAALQKQGSPALATARLSLLLRQGQRDQAHVYGESWIARHPRDRIVPSFLAEASRLGADPASAARWYKAALRAQPDHVATLNNLALALGQLKDPAAIGYAQKALKLAPNHPAVLDTAGWLQVQEGNLDGGLPLLEQAHALAPASAEIQLNLAKALLKAGRADDARTHLEALNRLPPASPLRKEAEGLLAAR
jgi:putative PEP-CTERM system TPR-repeat lipoprotein